MDNGDLRLPEAIVGAIVVVALLAAGFLANTASAAPAVSPESITSVCTRPH